MYCLHASSTNSNDDEILDTVIAQDDTKKVWSLKFKVLIIIDLQVHILISAMNSLQIPLDSVTTSISNVDGSNFYFCSGPRFELDYDASISHCRATFESMFPGEEFLPRAPEPEEIVIGGDDEEATGGGQEEKAMDQKAGEWKETDEGVSRNPEPEGEDSEKA